MFSKRTIKFYAKSITIIREHKNELHYAQSLFIKQFSSYNNLFLFFIKLKQTVTFFLKDKKFNSQAVKKYSRDNFFYLIATLSMLI